MELKLVAWKRVWPMLLAVAVWGCQRSSVREAPITGKASDPPVTMRPHWQTGERYVYRVDTITSSQVPRRNTGKLVRAETTLGQDLAFTVTNAASDDGRVLQMEILAVQMETSRDDGVTMSFDSDSRAVFVDENPLADRLQKLVGLRLAFHLSSENSVTRIDGVKEFADRVPGNNNNAVRGTAGAVLGRFFNQQFYRELVEMGMLPKDPVKIGDQWTVSRQANAGLWGTSSLIEITYRLRGWQQHEGTNCARVDFSGTFKPNTVARTNQQTLRRITGGPNSGNLEEGTITGQAWFNPELALAVDMICDQSITTKSTSIQRLRMPPGSNNVTMAGATLDTNGPPPVNPPQPPPPQTTNTTTTTTHQHTSIKLVELEPSPN